MAQPIRTALIATVSEQMLRQVVYLLAMQNIELLAVADSGQAALKMLSDHRPDLLVADAQLPALDGAALLQRILCSFCLPVRPAAILTCYPEFPVVGAKSIAHHGAVLLEKPLDADAFRNAVEQLQTSPPVFSAEQRRRTDDLLDALGVPEHPGRECLKQAALLCAADERCLHHLSGRLYPQLAKLCRMEKTQAERAMRHAIDLAWQSDQFDNQYRIFADTVDAGRGQPTCGEMISRLADILRLEG